MHKKDGPWMAEHVSGGFELWWGVDLLRNNEIIEGNMLSLKKKISSNKLLVIKHKLEENGCSNILSRGIFGIRY